jgi:hypothetical protein
MFYDCRQCGARVSQNMQFCWKCGSETEPSRKPVAPSVTDPGNEVERGDSMFQDYSASENSKRPKYGIIIAAVAAVVVLLVVGIGALTYFGGFWRKGTTTAGKDDKQPKTKIEEFQAKTGIVVVKGFTEIGEVSDLGHVDVTAMEFTETSSGLKSTGIAIEVKESGTLEKKERAFIDYDEIDSLISGIDYVSRANSSVTKHKLFEATYVTKGCFKVTAFNDNSNVMRAGISSGCVVDASVYMPLAKLSQVRQLIVDAKKAIDTAGR